MFSHVLMLNVSLARYRNNLVIFFHFSAIYLTSFTWKRKYEQSWRKVHKYGEGMLHFQEVRVLLGFS